MSVLFGRTPLPNIRNVIGVTDSERLHDIEQKLRCWGYLSHYRDAERDVAWLLGPWPSGRARRGIGGAAASARRMDLLAAMRRSRVNSVPPGDTSQSRPPGGRARPLGCPARTRARPGPFSPAPDGSARIPGKHPDESGERRPCGLLSLAPRIVRRQHQAIVCRDAACLCNLLVHGCLVPVVVVHVRPARSVVGCCPESVSKRFQEIPQSPEWSCLMAI
jgi:hypothetical protein